MGRVGMAQVRSRLAVSVWLFRPCVASASPRRASRFPHSSENIVNRRVCLHVRAGAVERPCQRKAPAADVDVTQYLTLVRRY